MRPDPARRCTLKVAVLVLPALCSCGRVRNVDPPPRPCVPACHRTQSCGELDGRLAAARQPLLGCIDEQGRHGHLAEAHRCYRSLRLLESARWWLSSLVSNDEIGTVYQPSETFRLEFLCQIERLAQARSPDEVERLYLDLVRSYP